MGTHVEITFYKEQLGTLFKRKKIKINKNTLGKTLFDFQKYTQMRIHIILWMSLLLLSFI